MGGAISLGDLKARIKYRADMDSSFIDDEQLTLDIQDGINELHEILVTSYQDYDVNQHEISVTAGTRSYNLPSDFFKEIKVFEKSSNDYAVLRKFNLDDLGQDLDSGSFRGPVARYRIMGNKIWFSPIPAGAQTVELWYSKFPELPTQDTDSVSFAAPPSWKDFIVYDCVAKALMREESDPSMAMQQKEMARARILTAVQQRDGEPDQVTDIYKRFSNLENDRFGHW